ncbi:hypothetical protein [Spirosoma endophyticum]|uniref:hypothetical protein n=1 Tax=Spirosoma endophyticum TaxID=662367 RepID=UPI0015A5EF66|nr:hypothetical protein [Spirosoma endophyticum]
MFLKITLANELSLFFEQIVYHFDDIDAWVFTAYGVRLTLPDPTKRKDGYV